MKLKKPLKPFYSKCCNSDIEYNERTGIDKCSNCKRILKDSDIMED